LTEKDLCFSASLSFSAEQVVAGEELVLQRLEWKLAFPTSMDFLVGFSRILGVDEKSRVFFTYMYICELAAQSPFSLFGQRNSILAASSIILANFCLPDDLVSTLWPKELVEVSGWTLEELAGDVVDLSIHMDLVRLGSPQLDIIQRRYRKPCRRCVAVDMTIPVLRLRNILDHEGRITRTLTA
jgi:hypothetical protein